MAALIARPRNIFYVLFDESGIYGPFPTLAEAEAEAESEIEADQAIQIVQVVCAGDAAQKVRWEK